MKRLISGCRQAAMAALFTGFIFTGLPALAAKDAPAQVSEDGLHLVKQTKSRLVYKRPGATFTQFKRVAILECNVQFSQRWLKDYNSSQRDPSRKIGTKDLDRAKADLATQFKKIFTDQVRPKGDSRSPSRRPPTYWYCGRRWSTSRSVPDLMTAGSSVTFVQDSGQMTLYLNSGTPRQIRSWRGSWMRARPMAFAQRSSSVSNRAAADAIMRAWAKELRERLDDVTGKGGAS